MVAGGSGEHGRGGEWVVGGSWERGRGGVGGRGEWGLGAWGSQGWVRVSKKGVWFKSRDRLMGESEAVRLVPNIR